ncbi:mitochondrial protein import protein ZIM17 isoform X4 [Cucumis melo]|uniref:Mitochondrial protein import protein ZIM17 isoform X4 n=1 Tax=Cucumis melo TaxID=3656 RepID=A0A1S4DWZ3_CUCME|nr:mitochondrial protein import protein ZIM17 isoform X4 [Cucumis melo]
MAAAKTVIFSSPTLLHHCFNPSQTPPHPSINSFKPILSSKANPSNGVFIRNFCTAPVTRGRRYKVLTVSSLVDGYTGDDDESSQRNSDTGAAIDIKLPRRSLMVTFTCNQCSERTKRLINRLAYERGLVFVQCAGCQKYHKLVDNLGLIVEYDFREEDTDLDSNSDQV